MEWRGQVGMAGGCLTWHCPAARGKGGHRSVGSVWGALMAAAV